MDDDFDDLNDDCPDCGEYDCICPLNGADDDGDPERYGHTPCFDDHILDGAIYLAEQARDARALAELIAQREGVPPCKVWPRFDPLPTRKHKLRERRRQKARERRALMRGRRAALQWAAWMRRQSVAVRGPTWSTLPADRLIVRWVEVFRQDHGFRYAATMPSEGLLRGFGAIREDHVLDIDRRGGDPDDIPW